MKPLSEETWVTPTLLRTHASEGVLLCVRCAVLTSFFLPPVDGVMGGKCYRREVGSGLR